MLDPFCGTGTTCAVAKRLGRRFLGIEREDDYATAARARVDSIEPVAFSTIAPFMTAREAPRIPFSTLLERGLILPGAILSDRKREVRALVRADGAVSLGRRSGLFTASAPWRKGATRVTAGRSGTLKRRLVSCRSIRCAIR